MADDMIIKLLKHYGEPVNRQTYLNLKYAGKPPATLGPEEEAALPHTKFLRTSGNSRFGRAHKGDSLKQE